MADVPNVPGVPPLDGYSDGGSPDIMTSDGFSVAFDAGAPQWGIFRDGENVIEADNTISVEFRQDFAIANYPVENGGFQSYDKVQLPIEIHVRVSAGGSLEARQAFLQSIDDNMNTTDLYDVVTPEQTYTGFNFAHRNIIRKSDSGVGLITVELWLIEIRTTAPATFTSTKSPASTAPQSTGTVQPGQISGSAPILAAGSFQ